MSTFLRSAGLLFSLSAIVVAGMLLQSRAVSADVEVTSPVVTSTTSIPESTIPADSPPTPVIDTPVAPPTITRERPGGVTSTTSIATVGEAPLTTPIASRRERSVPATAAALPTATVITIATPIVVPPEAPLPSPAELRQNARLRWGKGVPAAVRRWAFLIVPAAKQYGLSPSLIAAVMTMESGGDPLAYSPADARGLMQVLHGPWDPRQNVFTGVRMLADYHARFPDWSLTLAAYNAGPNAVSAYNGVPPFRETRDYVIVVTYLWDLYGHKHLSSKRKVQYHATLTDLQRYGKQRAKVRRLAEIAKVQDPKLVCSGQPCGAARAVTFFDGLDPFWPVSTGPDPLQRVDLSAISR